MRADFKPLHARPITPTLTKQTMLDLVRLLSQYEILTLTAHHLSTLDLYYTALTSISLYGLIAKNTTTFNHLKRLCLCDGKGLQPRLEKERNEYNRKSYPIRDAKSTACRSGLKCDEANPRPCEKCDVSICKECRCIPRVGDTARGPCRRPHCTTTYEMQNIMCYCKPCDAKLAESIKGEDYCDCDIYERWVCHKCAKREEEEERWYSRKRTKFFGGGIVEEAGMMLADHQHSRMYWCPCGVRAPADGNVRCTLCKRKHRTELRTLSHGYSMSKDTCLVFEEDGFWYPWRDDNTSLNPHFADGDSGPWL